ncbi:MAG TPA: nuclear transport factor 2 family protein [Acidimicrobiales bacterium]|nr:nuclear transport factor 2 family protein [Acidimicrobiales bacterium]
MGAAFEMSKKSMAMSEAKDREGWLELFADDAVVEDPVGPSFVDAEGKGQRGKEAITAFYDNVVSQSESLKFTIRQTIECGDEVINIGELRITLPGNQVAVVPIANIYKVNAEGKLASLRSFWEQDNLSFTAG